jgi:hypothetical protein
MSITMKGVNSSMIYSTYCRNIKCHDVPLPSTTIKKRKYTHLILCEFQINSKYLIAIYTSTSELNLVFQNYFNKSDSCIAVSWFLKIFLRFFYSSIYSHVHTLFGSFLPPPPSPTLSSPPHLASRQNLFCPCL